MKQSIRRIPVVAAAARLRFAAVAGRYHPAAVVAIAPADGL